MRVEKNEKLGKQGDNGRENVELGSRENEVHSKWGRLTIISSLH
jgi:hypothetical protein